jgi:RNA polymerase sigma-70 factor (ECF subfamily)
MPRQFASDDELMQAAARGEEEAFAALVHRHRGWVQRLMRAIVQDEEQAEDLTQEAFCRVYRHLDDYEPQGSFVAWLKRIAANRAKDFLRKRRKETLVPLCEVEQTLAAGSYGDPMAALASGLVNEEVRAAIQALPDDQRLPVVMHYFGQMGVSEIAWAMKCPVGTIKSRLFYGLRRVRQTLTERMSWTEE